MAKKSDRTSAHLRDVLFDEIEQLRGPEADPQRALAVAKLAREIVGIAKVEIDFMREMRHVEASGPNTLPHSLGSLQLGTSDAVDAKRPPTAS